MTNEINVNQDVVLIPSMTVASANPDNSPDQVNPYWRSCVIYLNISQASGTGGLTVNLQFKDPVSGNYASIYSSAVFTTTGLRVFYLAPEGLGGTHGGLTDGMAVTMARTFRVQVTKGDASSYTYSVGASMMK